MMPGYWQLVPRSSGAVNYVYGSPFFNAHPGMVVFGALVPVALHHFTDDSRLTSPCVFLGLTAALALGELTYGAQGNVHVPLWDALGTLGVFSVPAIVTSSLSRAFSGLPQPRCRVQSSRS
ncbi:hypothetical protein TMatcc_008325 [Talaromyces marneffei ATCC 18224]